MYCSSKNYPMRKSALHFHPRMGSANSQKLEVHGRDSLFRRGLLAKRLLEH